MRTLARIAVFVVLTVPSLYAGPPQKYADWATGPVRFLMTRDEQRTWEAITTGEEAQAFIDLFWARRDPTPGTHINEFQQEFDWRVKFADEHFSHPGRPGWATDRGHAIILLGLPTTGSKAEKQTKATAARFGTNSKGGGSFSHDIPLGEREIWVWEPEDARKFGMTKVEATFVQDPANGVVQRDTQRNLIITAYAAAIDKAIVNPDLTAAPEWSKYDTASDTRLPQKKPPHSHPAAAVPHRSGEPGAHSLLLVKNAAAIADPQTNDPLAGVTGVDSFARNDDLAYVFEYCGPSEALNVTIAISGNGVNMTAPAEEMPIERIRTVPECGIVRASIPLGDMQVTPGTYTFNVKLEDGPQSYNLSQDFKVE